LGENRQRGRAALDWVFLHGPADVAMACLTAVTQSAGENFGTIISVVVARGTSPGGENRRAHEGLGRRRSSNGDTKHRVERRQEETGLQDLWDPRRNPISHSHWGPQNTSPRLRYQPRNLQPRCPASMGRVCAPAIKRWPACGPSFGFHSHENLREGGTRKNCGGSIPVRANTPKQSRQKPE